MTTSVRSTVSDSRGQPREEEAQLLARLLRTSRVTLLIGETGSGKTRLLTKGVMPSLRRRASDLGAPRVTATSVVIPFPDRRSRGAIPPDQRGAEVAIFFDSWSETPLRALRSRICAELSAPAMDAALPPLRLADTLALLNRQRGVRFLFVFDAFENFLARLSSGGDADEFADELIEVANRQMLPAHFLIAMRDDAEPLLERFRQRITGFGDPCLRLLFMHGSYILLPELHQEPPPLPPITLLPIKQALIAAPGPAPAPSESVVPAPQGISDPPATAETATAAGVAPLSEAAPAAEAPPTPAPEPAREPIPDAASSGKRKKPKASELPRVTMKTPEVYASIEGLLSKFAQADRTEPWGADPIGLPAPAPTPQAAPPVPSRPAVPVLTTEFVPLAQPSSAAGPPVPGDKPMPQAELPTPTAQSPTAALQPPMPSFAAHMKAMSADHPLPAPPEGSHAAVPPIAHIPALFNAARVASSGARKSAAAWRTSLSWLAVPASVAAGLFLLWFLFFAFGDGREPKTATHSSVLSQGVDRPATGPTLPRLEILTDVEDGTGSRIGAELAVAMAQPGGVAISQRPTRDWAEGLAGLRDGPRLAIARQDLLQAARNGATDNPLRVVMPLYTDEIYFIVRADSPLAYIHDIKGRRINIGPARSGRGLTAAALYERMFGMRIPQTDIAFLGRDAALWQLVVGKTIDVMVLVGAQPASWLADLSGETARGMKLLKLDPNHPTSRKALQSYTSATVRPSSYHNWLTQETPTFAAMSYLVTSDAEGAAASQRLSSFAKSLCRALPVLQRDGHPKWREVRPAAQPDVGWPYSQAAAEGFRTCTAAKENVAEAQLSQPR